MTNKIMKNLVLSATLLVVSQNSIYAGSVKGPLKVTANGVTYTAMLSDHNNRPTYTKDYKEGPLQTVGIAYSGDFIISASGISRDPLGSPVSKTKATIEPSGNSLILHTDNRLLENTRFSDEKLAIEFDLRNLRALVGSGATFYVPPNHKDVQLGGFYVSSNDSWCSVVINIYPEKHTVTGEGCVLTAISEYVKPKQLNAGPTSILE